MTWNVFVGAEIETVLAEEDPGLIPLRVAEAWAAVQATDFHERAGAIADEIAGARPHVVGLQEISLFRHQAPGDFLAGNPVAATEVALDFVAVLLGALASRDLDYRVAGSVKTFDLEVPMAAGQEALIDIRLTDHDVILARGDVETSNARSGTFAIYLPVSLAGLEIPIHRGWVSVDARFEERTHRIVNTHLEPADDGGVLVPALVPIQAGQAAELLAVLDGFDGPVVLMGDLNSAADGSTTNSYADFRAAGFVDTWTVGGPRGVGFTANQPSDLRNPDSSLFHRIDYILYRDEGTRRDGLFHGTVDARLVGTDPGRRTVSGLWPSDHAGVVATLRPEPR